MHRTDHALIGAARNISIPSPSAILSFSPIVLPTPERLVNLELKATVPITGSALPIILFSHGQGHSNYLSSSQGYPLLAEFWAAHGFAVLQPTHLSSRFLGLKPPPSVDTLFYQDRAEDIVRILDHLETIESAVPGPEGRVDRSRVAIAGHSAGGWTVSTLLGASNTDPRDGTTWHKPEPWIKADLILAGLGSAEHLSDVAKTTLIPFYGGDFGSMTVPALVVCGDEDVWTHLTTRGADWHADPYVLAPGPKDLVALKGAKHGLGGISGLDTAEAADDESPERLALVQRMTWAWLKSRLFEEDEAWTKACIAFASLDQGTVETKERRCRIEHSPLRLPKHACQRTHFILA